MNELRRPPYRLVDQAVLWLGEDWMLDHDDIYQATEAWLDGYPDESLRQLLEEIDVLFEVEPDARSRMRHFRVNYAFSKTGEDFDVWLRALQQRAKEALAGIHSNPMTDPEGGPAKG